MVLAAARFFSTYDASFFDSLCELTDDWVYAKDLEHRFIFVNPALCRFMGLPPEKVLGRTSLEIGFSPDVVRHGSTPGQTGLWSDDEEVVRQGRPMTFRGKSLFWRGNWTYFDNHKAPLVDRDGRTIGVVATARLVTDLVEAMARLSEADQHAISLQACIDGSAIVAVTDARGKILSVNENFCRISGYGRDELVGKDHRVLNSGYHGKEFFADMWRTIRSGQVWHGEIRNRSKSGAYYWVFTTITPETGRGGNIERFVSIRFDITRQKQFEDDLQKQRFQLMHSEKMSSIGEVCAGLAHEINNPLAVIGGNVDRLAEEIGAGSVGKETLLERVGKVSKMVTRITKIIGALRSIARDGTKDGFEDASLSQILAETLELCQARFQNHGVKVEVECEADVRCRCKSVQISQVLLNLLINAFDAVQSLPEKWIKVRISSEGSDALIRVIDSGGGIPPEIAAQLMRPFFTTKPPGHGLGLGLSISKSIVDQHHGALEYCGREGRTCFQMRLPLRQP